MADEFTLERGEPGFPAALEELDAIGQPVPARLYGRGERGLVARLRPARAVTIVGARRCSRYGRSLATEIARALAANGVTVVSGMALGIDSAAHEGALDAGGATVAVLANGPDRAYPRSARALYGRILTSGGAVVSESPAGYSPHRYDFPKRNRLMAALAGLTIVVEARNPSGSRVTADRALALGRTVAGVPGPVDSPLSAGPHELIRDGAALVAGVDDVLELALGVGAGGRAPTGPPLGAEERRVLEAIAVAGVSLGQLVEASGLGAAAAAVAAARLELLGYVEQEAGRYARTGLSAP